MSNTDVTDLLGEKAAVSPAAPSMMPPPVTVAAVAGGMAHDAGKIHNEMAAWRPRNLSADAAVLPDKDVVDARADDMIRNDAFAASGVTYWKDSIVGARYMLNARPSSLILFGKEDAAWEDEFQQEVEARFSLWAESPANYVDARGVLSFTEIVRMGVGVYFAGGEVVQLARWLPKGERPYRTAIRFISADRLSDPLDRTSLNHARLRKGVEIDEDGRPVRYWFKNSHPSEGGYFDWSNPNLQTWTPVVANRPWGRANVLHAYESMRPDQNRGLSTLASALTEMRMFKTFNKTQLQKAVIAATYAASIEAELPNDVAAALGANLASDGNPTTQWILDYLASVEEYSGGSNNLHMNGAAIPVLMPGTKLNLQNPGAAGPDHKDYSASILRYLAAASDMPYEVYSRDFTETNYSSARAALGEAWKSAQTKKSMIADKVANFIYRLWLEESINQNEFETLKRRNVPNFYEGLNADAYSRADWIGAGRGTIDPLKETQADLLALKGGMDTLESVISRRTGKDWREVLRQQAREHSEAKRLGIPSVYEQDTQDQTNALSGSPQDRSDA